jgi:hypothetical protein
MARSATVNQHVSHLPAQVDAQHSILETCLLQHGLDHHIAEKLARTPCDVHTTSWWTWQWRRPLLLAGHLRLSKFGSRKMVGSLKWLCAI